MSWDLLLGHHPSPLETLRDPMLDDLGLRVLIKRDDLLAIHAFDERFPAFSGNKWRKLKYNLLEARSCGYDGLLSYGGPYSNHIAAVAAAGRIFGFRTIGIIRGGPFPTLNPTLAFAARCGMQLRYLDPSAFKALRDAGWSYEAPNIPGYLPLPEGGSNSLALKGCAELGIEILGQAPADYYCVSCGTGGTIAGLCASLGNGPVIMGFPALRNGGFLLGDIRKQLEKNNQTAPENLWLQTMYAFAGYGRWNEHLLQFMDAFHRQHGVLLDQVYTGKMCFGVFDLIRQGYFSRGATICIIHTGGLQGRNGQA
jgi:1-aminocyclopropane-1-carboxylate deaminase/D-cysteine desulfhydrase-like pyridoxal-dependent ACC family enzyme